MIWAAAIVNQQGRPQGSPYGGHVVGAPLVVAPTLGPLVCPPVDQCLDLGQDSRDSIDLGLEPDDTLELPVGLFVFRGRLLMLLFLMHLLPIFPLQLTY